MIGRFCEIRNPYMILPRARRLMGLINCGLFSSILIMGM